jgi:Cdc6-like AAA superfamily ATPase
MSTLTTTVNTSEIASLATGFLGKSAEVKAVVRQAIQQAPTVATAVIVAGEFAIEDAMTDDDKKFILKAITRGRILVEGGTKPPDDKCYAVIAQAESRGFDICTDQYSIWSNGKIYIKENGFRKLFGMREDCSELDTSIQPPQWIKLQDRSCWHVPVRAWVTVKGRGKIVVDCTVGVNGNLTDGINKIEAHAERSVLRKLWKKVTSISMDEDEGDDTVSGSVIVVDEPQAAITQQQEQTDMRAITQKTYDMWIQTRPNIIKDAAQLQKINDYWFAIEHLNNKDEARVIYLDLNKNMVKELGKNNVDELCRYVRFRQDVLPDTAEGGAA